MKYSIFGKGGMDGNSFYTYKSISNSPIRSNTLTQFTTLTTLEANHKQEKIEEVII
jgi:hypothetical protein